MRKYYQAALALTATLSLIALLFYRHEYNKLRFVLQVFNYFGTPSKASNETCTLGPATLEHFQADFAEPSATWQRIDGDLYVFSAYHMDQKIQAIAFGSKTIEEGSISCFVNAHPENPQKVMGVFSLEVKSGEVEGNLYELILVCKLSQPQANITSVEFVQKNRKSTFRVKVRSIEKYSGRNDAVVCVAPSDDEDDSGDFEMKRIDMVTFIAFHSRIGLNNIIVYDSGLPDLFNFAAKSLSRMPSMNFTYSTVSWNFPFPEVDYKIIRNIIETDCLYRSFGRANIAVTLTWNEYINLKYHSSVSTAVADLNKVSLRSTGNFDIETYVMCVEDSRDFESTPMILTTTNRLRGENKGAETHLFGLQGAEIFAEKRKRKMDDLAVVYKYESCNGDEEFVEGQVLNGADKTPGSEIFQYYLTRKLFTH